MRRLGLAALLLIAVAVLLVVGGVVRVRVERGDSVSASPFWREEPGRADLPPALAIWVELARTGKPAVVNVSTTQRATPRGGPDDFFRRFFGEPDPGPRRRARILARGGGTASGRASWRLPDGYVVTNVHVVRGASEIVV
jgi:S1-C subfamily serine protease